MKNNDFLTLRGTNIPLQISKHPRLSYQNTAFGPKYKKQIPNSSRPIKIIKLASFN